MNPAHLRAGTHKENSQDASRKGRLRGNPSPTRSPGTANGGCRLTEEQVLAVRADTRPYRFIAAEHSISRAHVSMIKNRKMWAHLPGRIRGVGTHRSRLTEEQVLAIRADTRPQRSIAADYGITQTNVSAIKRRQTWTHL